MSCEGARSCLSAVLACALGDTEGKQRLAPLLASYVQRGRGAQSFPSANQAQGAQISPERIVQEHLSISLSHLGGPWDRRCEYLGTLTSEKIPCGRYLIYDVRIMKTYRLYAGKIG